MASARRRKPQASAEASGREEGGAAAPRTGDAPHCQSLAGAAGAARSTAGANGSRRSGGGTRGKHPRPSECQKVEPPYAAHHKWYRVGSIEPEGGALRAHLSEVAVNRLAAAGGAPAGAVGLAISGVLRNGVDRLHESLRTSSYRMMRKAKDGLFKVVKELRRATHMEDDIGRILNEVLAADRVAFADEPFVFNDKDESGGKSSHGSLEAGQLRSGAGADPGGVRLLKAEDHHAPHGRRGGGGAACHRERGIGEVELHPGGAVARCERPPGLVLPARGDKGEVAWVRGDVGEYLRQQREGGVGSLFFEVRGDRKRHGAAARGVRGGQGQEPGQMSGRGGGKQVDRMRAPDGIECLEGGASQCPAGSRRVFGELRKEGRCPKGGDSLGG